MTKKISTKEYEEWSKDELIKEIVKIKSTTYGLVWHRDLPEEKIDILVNPDARTPNEMFPNEMAGKPFPVLKEVKGKAIESDKTKLVNLLIEGDNYHSLAVLNFTHREAVDLIYIDPPYNTGNNDFIYNDKFVDKEDNFRHSKWLSFMEKRLKLAKNLLKSNGAIFISIDDHEQAPLRMLCDEIFGEDNFLANFIWESKLTGGHDSTHVNTIHEYVLCYAKDSASQNVLNKRKSNTEYPQYDAVRKQNFKWDSLWTVSHGYTKNCDYPIFSPDNSEVFPWMCHKDKEKVKGIARWFWSKETYEENKKDLLVKKDKDGQWKVYKKVYGGSEIPFKSIFDKALVGGTSNGKEEVENIFGEVKIFDNPKPVSLIKEVLRMSAPSDATILDFMAGSGTTGQAVLESNKEDGGTRNFILCTNNGDEKSKHKIASDVCYPRIKKNIIGYKSKKGEKIDGLGGNLKYYTTDFVEAEPTDKNKRKLVKESTDMLCILENAFELIQETPEFKIFKNTDKYVGVIFYDEAIDDYKKAIKKIDGHFNTYVFSMNDDPHTVQFDDMKGKVSLKAIPEVVLKVYREIFK
ncbi:MAG: site-specific DNA-methyltransferase [Candidatus Paceibacterota bacterium]